MTWMYLLLPKTFCFLRNILVSVFFLCFSFKKVLHLCILLFADLCSKFVLICVINCHIYSSGFSYVLQGDVRDVLYLRKDLLRAVLELFEMKVCSLYFILEDHFCHSSCSIILHL